MNCSYAGDQWNVLFEADKNGNATGCEAEEGLYISHNDYARLKAEVEQLRKVMDIVGPKLFDAYTQLADAYVKKGGQS